MNQRLRRTAKKKKKKKKKKKTTITATLDPPPRFPSPFNKHKGGGGNARGLARLGILGKRLLGQLIAGVERTLHRAQKVALDVENHGVVKHIQLPQTPGRVGGCQTRSSKVGGWDNSTHAPHQPTPSAKPRIITNLIKVLVLHLKLQHCRRAALLSSHRALLALGRKQPMRPQPQDRQPVGDAWHEHRANDLDSSAHGKYGQGETAVTNWVAKGRKKAKPVATEPIAPFS